WPSAPDPGGPRRGVRTTLAGRLGRDGKPRWWPALHEGRLDQPQAHRRAAGAPSGPARAVAADERAGAPRRGGPRLPARANGALSGQAAGDELEPPANEPGRRRASSVAGFVDRK